MTERREQTLEAKLNLIKFPTNTALTYELDENVMWVQNLLREMNETATDKKPDEWLLETSLHIQIELTKKFKNEYGEYLLAKGNFQCTFATESVRTLNPVKETMDVDFKACFLHEPLLKTEEFEDIDENDLLYDKEVVYYDKIITEIKETIKNELAGLNQYERKETFESRRFIYNSDTCIALAHFLLRKESLDCKFFLRSSNVKDTLGYDLNFLKHMSRTIYDCLDADGRFCNLNIVINSGHIIQVTP